MIINWRKVMEEDLFEKILKELLNGESLRELQEKYHFDRKKFKERIDREYPIGTHQREQVENQLRENKKNGSTIDIPESQLKDTIREVLNEEILMEEAASICKVHIQTFKEKMIKYINKSQNEDLRKLYIEYQKKRNPDYSFINFKALFVEMLGNNYSQTEIAEKYGINARTVSRELEKLKGEEEYGTLYEMAKEFSDRKMKRKKFSSYENFLMENLLEKYKDEGPVLIEESISKEEIKYRKAKKIVEQEKEMEGTAEEKVKALGISISTLRRAKVEVEQYENLKKMKEI